MAEVGLTHVPCPLRQNHVIIHNEFMQSEWLCQSQSQFDENFIIQTSHASTSFEVILIKFHET
jgi:hypothetical protein